MPKQTNCPNCGAPITGSCCDYCGTHLEDILRLASGRPVEITFEIGGKEYTVNFHLDSMSVHYEPEVTTLYADGRPEYRMVTNPYAKLTMEGTCLPFDYKTPKGDISVFAVEKEL